MSTPQSLRIYVSCHRNDRELVALIVRDLSARLPSARVTWYMNVPGSSLQDDLLNEIRGAGIILTVLSPDYLSSAWAQQELAATVARRPPADVILLRAKDSDLPPSVAGFDCIDFTQHYNPAFETLLSRVTGISLQQSGGGSGADRTAPAGLTTSDLVRRREELADRGDALHVNSSSFVMDMGNVVSALKELAQEADGAHLDRLQRAKTWRYVARSLMQLGDAAGSDDLAAAQESLALAWTLMEGADDKVERMKWHLVQSQVLRRVARFRVDSRLVLEVGRHLSDALDLARVADPSAVSTVEELIANNDAVVPISQIAEAYDKKVKHLQSDLQNLRGMEHAPGGAAVGREGFAEFQGRVAEAADPPAGSTNADAGGISRLPGSAVESPFPHGRTGEILTSLGDLKRFVQMVVNDAAAPDGFRSAAMELSTRVAQTTDKLQSAASNEQEFRNLEMREARVIADDIRRFARQMHAMLVSPAWTTRDATRDVNRIFFSGPSRIQAELQRVASILGLTINDPAPPGADFPEQRWLDLRAAGVAVFDLTGRDPQVFYELGIALAIGSELLLVARAGATVPFDVSQSLRFYEPATDLGQFLERELDRSLYGVQVRGDRSARLDPTLAYVRTIAQAQPVDTTFQVLLQAVSDAIDDPVQFVAAMQVLTRTTSIGYQVAFPRWPAIYPEGSQRRCFVVMPFDPSMETSWQFVWHAAAHAQTRVIRGDIAPGQQIIRSIWDEICLATHVIVDLTRFNPNVCLELGIAHTVGKSVWLIGRSGTARNLSKTLPGVAKWRCHTYDGRDKTNDAFKAGIAQFLGSSGAI